MEVFSQLSLLSPIDSAIWAVGLQLVVLLGVIRKCSLAAGSISLEVAFEIKSLELFLVQACSASCSGLRCELSASCSSHRAWDRPPCFPTIMNADPLELQSQVGSSISFPWFSIQTFSDVFNFTFPFSDKLLLAHLKCTSSSSCDDRTVFNYHSSIFCFVFRCKIHTASLHSPCLHTVRLQVIIFVFTGIWWAHRKLAASPENLKCCRVIVSETTENVSYGEPQLGKNSAQSYSQTMIH